MWTPTALASEVRRRVGAAWRVVEGQHTVSTRKLVATQDDQALLEDILEATKPPVPQEAAGLHYLLHTPFRYDAPYPIGSRFRRAGSTEGVFYASEQIRTALAEYCNYRIRFFNESPATILPCNQECLSLFSVDYSSTRTVDLTQPPFLNDRQRWTHATDYLPTQAFADTARQAGVEIIRYESVRDIEPGINIALLSPAAFASKQPKTVQTWFLYLSEAEANCKRANANNHNEQWTFKQTQFAV